jgi:hypothetical protein
VIRANIVTSAHATGMTLVPPHGTSMKPGSRIARLRIAKSSISERRFAFQKTSDLRGENAVFNLKANLYEGRVETS